MSSLRGYPMLDIERAVHDFDTTFQGLSEEAGSGTIEQRDFAEVEDDLLAIAPAIFDDASAEGDRSTDRSPEWCRASASG
jgi:hypothetical protein